MRAFVSFVLLSGMALALPLEKRAKNVVPSTCDPAVVNVVLETLNSMSAPEIVMLATFETALVESRFNNLNFGDRDSLGVFQQRPSQGYTNPTDVAHATTAFVEQAIRDAKKHPDRSAGTIAQDVQRSGFPLRYEQNKQQAQKILDEVRAGGSLSCASKSANASSSPQTGATKQNSNDGKDDSVTTASSTLTKASDPTPTNTSIDPVGTESTLDSTSTIDDSTSADDNFTVNDATGSDVNSDGVVPEDDTHNTTGTTSGEGVTPDDTIQDQGALTDGVDDLLGIGNNADDFNDSDISIDDTVSNPNNSNGNDVGSVSDTESFNDFDESTDFSVTSGGFGDNQIKNNDDSSVSGFSEALFDEDGGDDIGGSFDDGIFGDFFRRMHPRNFYQGLSQF